MKKALLLFLFFLIVNNCFSQLTKGSFLIGGGISFQSARYTDGGNTTITFLAMPDAGYFFIDKLAGGIKSSFGYKSNDGDSRLDILAGPFARYYFLPQDKKVNIFFEGNFMLGTEKYENFDADPKTEYGVACGPAFFINRYIAVEALLSWRSLKYKDDTGRYNTFGMSIGFQLHLQPKRATGK